MKPNIHDLIEKWHEGDGEGQEIYEYLGLTWGQYAVWAEGGQLPDDCGLCDRKVMMESETKVDLGDLADITIMAGATEVIDWEARAKAAEAEARKFEGKYRGLRRRVVEVGSQEAANNRWCGEFDAALAKIDPLFRRVKAAKDDYQVTVVVSFTLRGMDEEPSERKMLSILGVWAPRWNSCLGGEIYMPNGISLGMVPTCKKINPVTRADDYNPELDEDDFRALGQPIPVFDDDDEDDDF